MMPKIDGIEVCRRLKNDATLPFMPIILVTAKADSKDVVSGLEAGADEYLTKPIDQMALVARVKSVLRLKALHDQVHAQATELADLNRDLEQRVADQLGEIERMSRLKRFLAPQIAQLVLTAGDEKVLESHRRDVTIVFCDLRGFTAFAETAEPEEVMTVLREYHDGLASLIHAFEGTLERFAGDGLMVSVQRSAAMSRSMRACREDGGRDAQSRAGADAQMAQIRTRSRLRHGHRAWLCHARSRQFRGPFRLHRHRPGRKSRRPGSAAKPRSGQILIEAKVFAAVEGLAELEEVGEVTLKGFQRPVLAHNVKTLRS